MPKRTNIVVTRDPYFSATGILVAHSIDEALKLAHANGETEAFIIGGGVLYGDTQALWDKVYLTEVDATPEGDVFFPNLDMKNWKEVWREAHTADEKNEYDYTFRILERNKAASD